MIAPEKTELRHWIYLLSEDLLDSAYAWRDRKNAQGKWYQVIAAGSGANAAETLRPVGNDDVLYVLGRSAASLGKPEDLTAQFLANGLDRGHRVVKIFASHSGDSFAEKLYEAMRPEYPNVIVYGYGGEVTPNGFSGHKSAGLQPGETLEGISEEDWNARKLRAKENRVRFPPVPPG